MGSVSTPELAVAVADAGGVGSITALGVPAEVLDGMVTNMAARTTGALAVNFLTDQIDRDAVAAAASRVRIIDFFWSEPNSVLVEIAHQGGALACWQVGSLEQALAAVDAGCDIIVAQGTEAGGHVWGQTALRPLLESILRRVEVPVVAAGGIGSATTFHNVMEAGAAGARIGTRFVATVESGAHPDYKRAIVEAKTDSTEITDAFSVCPLCAVRPRARVLKSCIHALSQLPGDTVGDTVLGGQTITLAKGHGLPPGSAATGSVQAMAMYAGESVADVHDILPVRKIIESWWPDRPAQ